MRGNAKQCRTGAQEREGKFEERGHVEREVPQERAPISRWVQICGSVLYLTRSGFDVRKFKDRIRILQN